MSDPTSSESSSTATIRRYTEVHRGITISMEVVDGLSARDVDQQFEYVKTAIKQRQFADDTTTIKILPNDHSEQGKPDTKAIHLQVLTAETVNNDPPTSDVITEPRTPSCSEPRVVVQEPLFKPHSGALSSVVAKLDNLWNNGITLTYGFMQPNVDFQANRQMKIAKVIKEWEACANIKFQQVKNAQEAAIRIAFRAADKDTTAPPENWSHVGTKSWYIEKNSPTMLLGGVGPGIPTTLQERYYILHEFGHALGLMHEHQSPVRNAVINLDRNATIKRYVGLVPGVEPSESMKKQIESVDAQILHVLEPDKEVSSFSDYDPLSIMNYEIFSDMNPAGVQISRTSELSPRDKAYIRIHYPGADRKEFEDALKVVEADEHAKSRLLEKFDKKDWEGVRFAFMTFCGRNAIKMRRIP